MWEGCTRPSLECIRYELNSPVRAADTRQSSPWKTREARGRVRRSDMTRSVRSLDEGQRSTIRRCKPRILSELNPERILENSEKSKKIPKKIHYDPKEIRKSLRARLKVYIKFCPLAAIKTLGRKRKGHLHFLPRV
ncbi:hypothetical protein Salat_0744500 [Sesamum alatum]|uniref:Uncharacterized protein n=1 Tax=Sesamum alatum TaxID=300844 RepID=A0AAE1YSA3_9LAMI|nr:hypothetical protein Salat_0744500 [Sesamum alatum]